MRRLLAGAVAVADDPAAAPCRTAQRFKERGGQVEIGLDDAGHRNILKSKVLESPRSL